MMKWLSTIVLVGLVAGSWMMFSNKGKEMDELKAEFSRLEMAGEMEKAQEIETELSGLEGERTFSGILLTFLSAGLVGIVFVVYLLPFFAQRVTHAVYDSAEMIEKDVMHDARSLTAQGDFAGAIEAYKQAAAADPLNRLPYVEIAKIYKDNLHDPASAIQTIRHALESQEWEVNDAAYFLFRLAELYDEVESNRVSARQIMEQVINEFPNTRHSANARQKLHEWDLEEEELAKHGGVLPSEVSKGDGGAEAAPSGPVRYELPGEEEYLKDNQG